MTPLIWKKCYPSLNNQLDCRKYEQIYTHWRRHWKKWNDFSIICWWIGLQTVSTRECSSWNCFKTFGQTRNFINIEKIPHVPEFEIWNKGIDALNRSNILRQKSVSPNFRKHNQHVDLAALGVNPTTFWLPRLMSNVGHIITGDFPIVNNNNLIVSWIACCQ